MEKVKHPRKRFEWRRESGTCERCGLESSPIYFDQMSKGQPYGWHCATCVKIGVAAKRHGANVEWLEEQWHKTEACQICRQVPHGTGLIFDFGPDDRYRGIICRRCKQMIGFARNQALLLKNGMTYLLNGQYIEPPPK